MCYSPIHIKNRALRVNSCTPQTLTIPCGHCWQCRATKVNGIMLRALFEYHECKRQGGFALFVTFTYDPEHLPVCTIDDIPCFSRRDVQLFLKRLRQSIYRKYKVRNSLRYFISSEYGDENYRPHYHAILYFTKLHNPYEIKKLVVSSWQNGIVSFGQYGGIVSDDRAVRYVAKYTSKDCNQDKHYTSRLQFIKRNIAHLEAELIKYKHDKEHYYYITNELSAYYSQLDDYKRHRPFWQASVGFGLCMLKQDTNGHYIYSHLGVSDENLKRGYIPYPDKSNGVKQFKLPKYYDLKLYYSHKVVLHPIIPNRVINIFTLNDRGEDMLKVRMQAYEYMISNLLNKVKAHVTQSDLDRLPKTYTFPCHDIKEFHKYLDDNQSLFNPYKTYAYNNIEVTPSRLIDDVLDISYSASPYIDALYLRQHDEYINNPNPQLLRDICLRAIEYNVYTYDIRMVINHLLGYVNERIEEESRKKELKQIEAKIEKRRLYRKKHKIPFYK